MKKRRQIVSIMAGILAAILLLSLLLGVLPNLAHATEDKGSSEIKQEIEEQKKKQEEMEAEIKRLEGLLSGNLDEIEDIVKDKRLIDQEIFLLNSQIASINQQIAQYSKLIADKQEELDAAQARLDELREKTKERIRAMEEDGKLSYWSVLFKANSFADLLDRINMIQEIASADRRRIQELKEATQLVADAKAELVAEKADLEAVRADLAATQEDLQKKQETSNGLLEKLLERDAEFRELLEYAEERSQALAEQLAKLEDDLDAAEKREYEEWLKEQQQNQQPTNGPAGSNTVNGITWLTPIKYTRFSSPYGYRVHPIGGDWRFHAGVDLSAPTGTPIYATRSGVVTTADYQEGGAGNYVYINHQDGYKSVYMHMTHYIVSEGDWVVAGQVIGYCGSTGGSTGPHLHFGIYYNGNSVNPAEYIKIS